jgi:hypothetical protein
MNVLKKVFLAATLVAGVSTGAQAGLIGDTITGTGTGLVSANGTNSAVIGNSFEFVGMGGKVWFDFTPTQLILTVQNKNVCWGDMGTYVFSGFDDTITSFVWAPENNNLISGITAADLSFANHSLSVRVHAGGPINVNSALDFNINVPVSVPGTSIPEPTSVALLGLGLLGFAAARRKSVKGDKA